MTFKHNNKKRVFPSKVWIHFLNVTFWLSSITALVLTVTSIWELSTFYFSSLSHSNIWLESFWWPYAVLSILVWSYWYYRLQGVRPNGGISQSVLYHADWATRKLIWSVILRANASEVNIAHLLWGLLRNNGFRQTLTRLDMTQDEVAALMHQTMNESIDEVLAESLEISHELKLKITWQELTKAIFTKSPSFVKYFENNNIKLNEAVAVVDWTSKYLGQPTQIVRSSIWEEIFQPKRNLNKAWTAKATPVLDRYSRNLTELARVGLLVSAKVRHKEMEDAVQALSKSSENNLILVGDTGVGKTSIVGELAKRMISGKLPRLVDYKLISLNVIAMLGSSNFQNLFSRAIQEASYSGNTILFIGNLSELAKAKTDTGFNLSAILLDALQARNLQLIGTSDPGNYKKYIENNKGLASKFVRVNVPELDFDNAILVLEDLSHQIETRQGVVITLEAIKTAVKLSHKLIHTGRLPDKAESVLDETAAYVVRRGGMIVTNKEVKSVISNKTNVPIGDIGADEKNKLRNLEEKIHERLIGQDNAVEAVVEALKRSRLGVSASGKRPIGSFLFLGPTGVGKTELAKSLAWAYFGDETKMIRLDMGEYQTRESVHSLFGAPMTAGDVALSGGSFTEAVKKMPFAVVLLDEIEKAHDEILNVFLRMLDEGKVTDNLGNEIDFTHTIIIATSNAEARMIENLVRDDVDYSVMQKQLVEKITQTEFKPEFINRFDGVIVFKPLSLQESLDIVKIKIKKLKTRLRESKDIILEITEKAIKALVEKGFDPAFGARPLERLIRDKIEGKVANTLLKSGNISQISIDEEDILG
ncbi:MAG: ATP-dependent Clp protease ATP-binding subunit [Patescibacteria group bacterium]|nr:ATP-dependent Clp protease ATP-binding subunit [Patescibacteria group bacterium]